MWKLFLSPILSLLVCRGLATRYSAEPLSRSDTSDLDAKLRHADPVVRCQGTKDLVRMGARPDTAGTVPRLVELTRDKDACVRGGAVEALGVLAAADNKTLALALNLLNDESNEVQIRAAGAVIAATCKQRNAKDLPVLLHKLKLLADSGLKSRLFRAVSCYDDASADFLMEEAEDRDRALSDQAINALFNLASRTQDSQVEKRIIDRLKKALVLADPARKHQLETNFRLLSEALKHKAAVH